MYQTKFKPTKAGLLEARTADIFAENFLCMTAKEFYGSPFMLEDWQYKNMWLPVFGCMGRDNKRKFRRFLFLLPRDHGKSEIACRMITTHANLYPEYQAEYGIFASSKEQAKIIYGKIGIMIRQNPQLAALWDVQKKEIVHKETGARIRVFPCNDSEAQGIHFKMAIIDEMHVIKSGGMYDSITSGMTHVKDSVLIVISTAGEKRDGYFYNEFIPQFKKDKRAYIYWVGTEENDDPTDRTCWKKAMPASWIDYSELEDAFESSSLASFTRYYLNQFPAADESQEYVFTDDQLKNVVRARKEWDWSGRLVLGIDGAQNGDNFALVYARRDDDGKLGLFPIIFDKAMTEHGHYDLTFIEELIADNYANHSVELTAMDPARLLLLSQHMEQKYSIEFEEFAQNNKMMCAACGYLYREVVSGRIRVYGPQTDLFIEHLKHTTRETREPYGFRFSKCDKSEKIDAAIAASIAAIKLDTLPDARSMDVFFI